MRETNTIPVVFSPVSDPLGSGFVKSLARPGGDATGFVNIESSVAGKWIELLKELAPQTSLRLDLTGVADLHGFYGERERESTDWPSNPTLDLSCHPMLA
jgi:hypothetical protein